MLDFLALVGLIGLVEYEVTMSFCNYLAKVSQIRKSHLIVHLLAYLRLLTGCLINWLACLLAGCTMTGSLGLVASFLASILASLLAC